MENKIILPAYYWQTRCSYSLTVSKVHCY